ncbi:MAG: hypothetical protein L0Y71_01620 [Gemmataceae bacterium]|nr:hypothetical protein [Gemmataceae bacterium]
MLRLASALRSPRSPRSSFRPRLEALESRDCPSGTDMPPPAPPPMNMPPMISFSIAPAGPTAFTLSGSVMDEAPDGMIVHFSGAYTGSTLVGSDGSFSVTVTPNELGAVTAECTDAQGLAAQPVQQSCMSLAPMISLSATRLVNNLWAFSGTVSDEHAAGLTVRFGGLPSLVGKYATVTAQGSYSLTVELAQGEEGTASAQTTDWWGIDSNLAEWMVHPSA